MKHLPWGGAETQEVSKDCDLTDSSQVDKMWDKLTEYTERYSPIFFMFSMFYLMLYLIWGFSVWVNYI